MATPDAQVFDVRSATVSDIRTALMERRTTCRSIVLSYLARIRTLNPYINAIISLDPTALEQASALDKILESGHSPSDIPLLFGSPILLKDNFDLDTLPTTCGSLALSDCWPQYDAPTVVALKRAGGIILGKTNLHEFALEGLTVSSLGGQTRNPYDLTRTPGGSSGGSGAALAAGLAVLATGSDTMNSLRSPASACGIVSVRPSRGLVSRSGVIPVSGTQDAVGPMGKNVRDVAAMLTVMAGVGADEKDAATALVAESDRNKNYEALLGGVQLEKLRLGVIETFLDRDESGDEYAPVNHAMDTLIDLLEASGTSIIHIHDEVYDSPRLLKTLDTQRYEFAEELTKYLSRPELSGAHPKSANDVFSGNDFLVIPSQYHHVRRVMRSSSSNQEYKRVQEGISELRQHLHTTFLESNFDALIYPQQKHLVAKIGSPNQKNRNGILAALTGFPAVCLTIGFSQATATAPKGIPIGMELLGRPMTEERLLGIGEEIEKMVKQTKSPALAAKEINLDCPKSVPIIKPDVNGIPEQYPLSTL